MEYAQTRALRTVRPLSWRRWPGVIADVWHVQGDAGAGGFYVAPDPRLVVFLGGATGLGLRTAETADWQSGVTMLYVPAHVPLWSRFETGGIHVHLDLHLDAGPLAQRLRDQPGAAPALERTRLEAAGETTSALAALIAAEVETPRRPDMASDGLLSALLSEVLDLGAPTPEAERGGLSPRLIARLRDHAHACLHRRIGSAELAEIAGLSESWLTRGFRTSLGRTPQQWLMELRLETAQALMVDPSGSLADIAAACGFSDQAHLTRAFRSRYGETPGCWRRRRSVPDSSNHAARVQGCLK